MGAVIEPVAGAPWGSGTPAHQTGGVPALATCTGASVSGVGFMRIKKLKGSGIIAAAARHNRREIQAELGSSASINGALSHLNETLDGAPTAADVAKLAKTRMREAGITKTRKDAVLGLELVFSLSADHALNDREYFSACAAWAANHFGGRPNILSADIHRDESAPHCHVLIVPLIDGRLSGSDLMGDRRKLAATQQEFFDKVSRRFGMTKPPARLAGAAKLSAATAVLDRLRTLADPVLKSRVWPTVRDAIEGDPARFLDDCGIHPPQPKKKVQRTSTQIFTSEGKGPKRFEENPIGFAARQTAQSLCPVGFGPAAAATASPVAAQPEAQVDHPAAVETVRVREEDLDPANFDPVTGEFVRPASRREQRNMAVARDWVKTMLSG